jgi:Tfp pilus assembly PilM family ATPase
MARNFPPDVLVLDSDGLLHARFSRSKRGLQIVQAKSYRLAADTFSPSIVTPELANEASLADAIRRLRVESGRWDRASVLLPDSWFRMNILELPSLPEGSDAEEMVRWSLKRTMPIDPALLRLAYEVLTRTLSQVRVLTLSAVEQTLSKIERVLAAAGIEVVLIEPIGLNIWNAITVREPSTTRDRIFFYIRERDFTTAAFRGQQPLFIRSRNLDGERTLEQEIKLSASYLRDTLRTEAVENCYVVGDRIDRSIADSIGTEFGAPVRTVALRNLIEQIPAGAESYETELTACSGVFTP